MKWHCGINSSAYPTSHPVRGAWIEMLKKQKAEHEARSHPVRGAWIEI